MAIREGAGKGREREDPDTRREKLSIGGGACCVSFLTRVRVVSLAKFTTTAVLLRLLLYEEGERERDGARTRTKESNRHVV